MAVTRANWVCDRRAPINFHDAFIDATLHRLRSRRERARQGCQEPNNDPNFGGEDCTIKWNDGTTWNDVPCDFTYPCYCQDVKGGGY